MPNIELTMQALALVSLVLYVMPRLIGGSVGAWLPRVAAALLAVAFVLALIDSWFWFAKR